MLSWLFFISHLSLFLSFLGSSIDSSDFYSVLNFGVSKIGSNFQAGKLYCKSAHPSLWVWSVCVFVLFLDPIFRGKKLVFFYCSISYQYSLLCNSFNFLGCSVLLFSYDYFEPLVEIFSTECLSFFLGCIIMVVKVYK